MPYVRQLFPLPARLSRIPAQLPHNWADWASCLCVTCRVEDGRGRAAVVLRTNGGGSSSINASAPAAAITSFLPDQSTTISYFITILLSKILNTQYNYNRAIMREVNQLRSELEEKNEALYVTPLPTLASSCICLILSVLGVITT
jgi:hypothetical protein